MILVDKLYKSSEVCDILGVSLRTLYRYIEDGKLGSVQLASGRHRFTKDQIEKFLQLGPTVKEEVKEEKEVVETKEVLEEPIKETPMMGLGAEEEVEEEEKAEEPEIKSTLLAEDEVFKPLYFRCPFDDLRVIAKLIKRAGENASADYAFTGPAGLSLFYPIKAFDKLHVYVSPDQMDFWKLRLQLEESSEEFANVVIIKADTVDVFSQAGERGGLKHVSVERIKDDLKQMNMAEELKEFESKGY
ncbi:helix-turn-helix domain-containing protein [Candidatus Parcubacteria bacterium]|nr:helix-turn-helix domain-containing protein [Patescibacteria group bacterium]MCG2689380.1 helix-turn-helix domain-containing protein [Candidatus Parcubacteria bacterium]